MADLAIRWQIAASPLVTHDWQADGGEAWRARRATGRLRSRLAVQADHHAGEELTSDKAASVRFPVEYENR